MSIEIEFIDPGDETKRVPECRVQQDAECPSLIIVADCGNRMSACVACGARLIERRT